MVLARGFLPCLQALGNMGMAARLVMGTGGVLLNVRDDQAWVTAEFAGRPDWATAMGHLYVEFMACRESAAALLILPGLGAADGLGFGGALHSRTGGVPWRSYREPPDMWATSAGPVFSMP